VVQPKFRKAVFIPGEGIGPEVAWAARRCIEAAGARVAWRDAPAGRSELLARGRAVSTPTLAAMATAGVVLKGPLESDRPDGSRSVDDALFAALGIFSSTRWCAGFEGVPGAAAGMDLRISTWLEEHPRGGDAGQEPGPFMRRAFAAASRDGRRLVTIVHAGRARDSGGWKRAADEAARMFPGLEIEEQTAEHTALQLTRSPGRFDVVLARGEAGRLLAGAAAGMVGGLGMVPEAFHGTRGAVYTSVHGTAPRHEGTERANPVAMILAGVLLLEDWGEASRAGRVVAAVREALFGGVLTADLLPPGDPRKPSGTSGLVEAVITRVRGGGSLSRPAKRPILRG